MLSIDLAEISDEECIFITRLAAVMIDTLNHLLQSISNQLFRVLNAIMFDMFITSYVGTFKVLVVRISACKAWCWFNGGVCGR